LQTGMCPSDNSLFCNHWLILAYKMHTHISKSLQTQWHAIQNAVKTYNAALSPDTAPAVDEVEELTQEIGTLIEYLSDLTLHPWTSVTCSFHVHPPT
jgi:hypothetical protein